MSYCGMSELLDVTVVLSAETVYVLALIRGFQVKARKENIKNAGIQNSKK